MLLKFISITFFIILAVLSPGPDFIVVTKNTLLYKKYKSFYTAFGVTCGAAFLSILCLSGLMIIIMHSLLLFDLLKIIGSIYLFYLGIKLLYSKKDSEIVIDSTSVDLTTGWSNFKEGLFVSILNPKAWIFFVTLFTMIINFTNSVFFQLLFSIEVCFFYFVWFVFIVMVFDHPTFNKKILKLQSYLKKVFGILLIVFSLLIIRDFL